MPPEGSPSSSAPESGRRRATAAALLIGALALAAALLFRNAAFYHDDAYIALRYARNLLDGHGLVWNPGEYVQGYTSILHVVLVAFLGWLGVDLVAASRLVGLGAWAALLVVVFLWCRPRSRGGAGYGTLAPLLVLTSAPMIVWALGGLEGTLFSLLATAGCLLLVRDGAALPRRSVLAAAGTCLALASLARPDGVIFLAVSCAWLLARRQAREHATVVAFVAPAAVILAGTAIWQLSYYGHVVPNTFYAKTAWPITADRLADGIRYVGWYALTPPFLPILSLGALVRVAVKRAWEPRLTYLCALACGYGLFVVAIGGDHMPAFRLLLPLVPLLGCVVAITLATPPAGPAGRRPAPATLAAAIALALSSAQWLSPALNPLTEDPASRIGTIVGRHIASAWPPGSLVALNTAGSTPYYAGQHRYIDMLGLNDAHIARRHVEVVETGWQRVPGHLKGDGAYVLDRHPDYIIVGPAEGTTITRPWFLSDLEMGRRPEFSRDYAMRQVRLGPAGEQVARGGLLFTYYQKTTP